MLTAKARTNVGSSFKLQPLTSKINIKDTNVIEAKPSWSAIFTLRGLINKRQQKQASVTPDRASWLLNTAHTSVLTTVQRESMLSTAQHV